MPAGGRGEHVGGTPYGWRTAEHELTEDPAEQAVITRMRALRADGCSLRQIADALNADAIRPRRGDRWCPVTVSQVLDWKSMTADKALKAPTLGGWGGDAIASCGRVGLWQI
jgi:Recombinase